MVRLESINIEDGAGELTEKIRAFGSRLVTFYEGGKLVGDNEINITVTIKEETYNSLRENGLLDHLKNTIKKHYDSYNARLIGNLPQYLVKNRDGNIQVQK